jgi:hypothetical protein
MVVRAGASSEADAHAQPAHLAPLGGGYFGLKTCFQTIRRVGMVAGLAQVGLPRKTMQLAERQAALLLQQMLLAAQPRA